MSIKKAYVEIIELLEANQNKKVSTMLKEIKAMCESKTKSKTFVKDTDGNVTHIFCYYHKHWECVQIVAYGQKQSSSTGLNTMCKLGVKAWTKTQRALKDLDTELLTKVINEEIDPSTIATFKQARIDEIKELIADKHKEERFVEESELFEANS